MQVINVDQTTICPSALGPLLGCEPEGLSFGSDGVITIRVGDVGVRLTLRLPDAYAIGQVLNEYVAKSILLDLQQPRGRA